MVMPGRSIDTGLVTISSSEFEIRIKILISTKFGLARNDTVQRGPAANAEAWVERVPFRASNTSELSD